MHFHAEKAGNVNFGDYRKNEGLPPYFIRRRIMSLLTSVNTKIEKINYLASYHEH